LMAAIPAYLALLLLPFRTRLSLQLEVLALRHQLTVCQRAGTKPRPKPADRLLWVFLSRVWFDWQDALVFAQPATVIACQRRRFREPWTRLSRRRRPGRPATAPEIRQLIRRMSQANSGRGAPRILGELGRLGIVVAETTVHKYMLRRRKPPSSTWRAFLGNHTKDLVGRDRSGRPLSFETSSRPRLGTLSCPHGVHRTSRMDANASLPPRANGGSI